MNISIKQITKISFTIILVLSSVLWGRFVGQEFDSFMAGLVGILAGIGTTVIMSMLIIYVYRILVPWLPYQCEYPLYLLWKEDLVQDTSMPPLIIHSIRYFANSGEMDKWFWEGGFGHAQITLLSKMEEIPSRMKEILDERKPVNQEKWSNTFQEILEKDGK